MRIEARIGMAAVCALFFGALVVFGVGLILRARDRHSEAIVFCSLVGGFLLLVSFIAFADSYLGYVYPEGAALKALL